MIRRETHQQNTGTHVRTGRGVPWKKLDKKRRVLTAWRFPTRRECQQRPDEERQPVPAARKELGQKRRVLTVRSAKAEC